MCCLCSLSFDALCFRGACVRKHEGLANRTRSGRGGSCGACFSRAASSGPFVGATAAVRYCSVCSADSLRRTFSFTRGGTRHSPPNTRRPSRVKRCYGEHCLSRTLSPRWRAHGLMGKTQMEIRPNAESRGTPATSVLSPPTWARTHPPPLNLLSATRTRLAVTISHE